MNSKIMKSAFCSITSLFISVVAQNIPKRSFARAARSNFMKRAKDPLNKDPEVKINSNQSEPKDKPSKIEKTQKAAQKLHLTDSEQVELKKSAKKKRQLEEELENDPDQNYLLTCKTINQLFEIYQNSKHELKPSHFVTILHQLAKLRIHEQLSNEQLLKDQRVLDLIEHIKLIFDK